MASSRTYLEFVLDQLSALEDVRCRAMMGEFILYYRGKIVGGIYDDRLLVKPVSAALECIREPHYALPYEGAKPMLLVEEVDDREALCALIRAMEPELPVPKKRRKKT